MTTLPNVIAAITADGLAVLMNQPPTATLSELMGVVYQEWLNKKAKEAHAILLTEISKGKRLSTDVDPNNFFGLLHRYLNATKQGAARQNLRLMAQVLAGSLESDCPFTPDELTSNAELVASLSRNEIKFLATIWKCHQECQIDNGGVHVPICAHNKTLELMVPKILNNEYEFFALGGALTRTGLIVAQSVWDGTRFDVTPRLAQLVRLCDLESALSSE